jgi:hypothetical protein
MHVVWYVKEQAEYRGPLASFLKGWFPAKRK